MKFYSTNSSDLSGLNIFGQLVHCPIKSPGPKLKPRAQVVSYLHRVQPRHILVELENGSTQRIRSNDFSPYNPAIDTKVNTMATFHRTGNTVYDINDYKANANYSSIILMIFPKHTPQK